MVASLPNGLDTLVGDRGYRLSGGEKTARWKEGHFAFQQHDPGSRVEIRKVEVQELP